MKRIVVGVLAHVDAGKTTLSEALLAATGKIKQAGRVDHRDTYLDTHTLEKERGITIFSKEARFSIQDMEVVLLDTPGHVDFSAETERTLAVLDYAIFVISGTEGVQAHTKTLWSLLSRYHVPTFLFITKMDQPTAPTQQERLRSLQEELSEKCLDFSNAPNVEAIAMLEEDALETYIQTGSLSDETIARFIQKRLLFPCYFGSGLREDGIDAFLQGLYRYTVSPTYTVDEFAAQVYKIGHDKNGVRLTWMKITRGTLRVRQTLSYMPSESTAPLCEKITQIRLYSGNTYETAESAHAGQICSVAGLSKTYAGQGIGNAPPSVKPLLTPVLTYRILLPPEVDAKRFLPSLRQIEEEEPLLQLVWNERYAEIHAQIMGEIQTEILTSLVQERFGVSIAFTDVRILYRETITEPVMGVGHFEPLRHYAEVHLLLSPLPRGTGMQFSVACDPDLLGEGWQRQILSFLQEKQHIGVLTGAPITDIRVTLIAGKAHLKHTQGGDFREASFRAIRQGLMTAQAKGYTQLLEPYYDYTLKLPNDSVGRAMTDILSFGGTVEQHTAQCAMTTLTGSVPISSFSEYAREVAAYTHGEGKLSCRVGGYLPCHNTESVLAAAAYNPVADLDNTPDSVFCAHGAGFTVPWQEVAAHQHLEPPRSAFAAPDSSDAPSPTLRNQRISDQELEAIMLKEFGSIKRRVLSQPKEAPHLPAVQDTHVKKSFYIVDGYNLLFAWDEFAAMAKVDFEQARTALMDVLANYQAFTHREILLVFDAYNVKNAVERSYLYHNIQIVFTKEGELADTYIEKWIAKIGQDYSVRAVTSDALIQLQAVRSGVLRLSAREFREEVLATDTKIREFLASLRTASDKSRIPVSDK